MGRGRCRGQPAPHCGSVVGGNDRIVNSLTAQAARQSAAERNGKRRKQNHGDKADIDMSGRDYGAGAVWRVHYERGVLSGCGQHTGARVR